MSMLSVITMYYTILISKTYYYAIIKPLLHNNFVEFLSIYNLLDIDQLFLIIANKA